MKYSFRLEFTGREMVRDEFEEYCIYIVTAFLNLPEKISTIVANGILPVENRVTKQAILEDLLRPNQKPIRLFLEIFRNIYDHNGAWGYAEFTLQDNNVVTFRIGNSTNPTPETNEHQPEIKLNFGLGLNQNVGYLIPSVTKNIFTEFFQDIDQGYLYTGSYKKDSV